jgi:PPOX class probable F420-dependent enzyme
VVREQRRGRRIAMSPEERDEFLAEQRTCRLASVDGQGRPHVSALWFVWDGSAMWFTSLVRSQRWVNLQRDPNVSVLVDTGHTYQELRGVEITGRVEAVGEIPRVGEPNESLAEPERLLADKYTDGQVHYDQRHAWLRLEPEKIVSWDFRKATH